MGVIYVEKTGSDENDGSLGKPLRSVHRARELATAGDSVSLGAGEWDRSALEGITIEETLTLHEVAAAEGSRKRGSKGSRDQGIEKDDAALNPEP